MTCVTVSLTSIVDAGPRPPSVADHGHDAPPLDNTKIGADPVERTLPRYTDGRIKVRIPVS